MHIENRSISVAEFIMLRDAVGWPRTHERTTVSALKNSIYSAVAVKNNHVIGFGRIIGDGGLYFYIQDIMVHPECQGRGVGKALMHDLLHYIETHAGPGAFVGLMAAKGRTTYYEQFGFRVREADAPGMYLQIE